MKSTELSLILPCYNEAEHITKSLPHIISQLDKLHITYEIILVEDCSSDETIKIIRHLMGQHPKTDITLLKHAQNKGRGAAVMTGASYANGTIIGYMDIDCEISPTYIKKALKVLNSHDMVVAKRSYNFSFKNIHRYIATNGYRLLGSTRLQLPISDSEAGFKFMKREVIEAVDSYIQHTGWFWDTEVVYYAHKLGFSVTEIPVRFVKNFEKTSTVNTVKDSLYYLKTITQFLRQKRI